jgi:hypothetical protein
VCPQEFVVNSISGPDRSGQGTELSVFHQGDNQFESSGTSTDLSYYLLNGEQRVVSEFDTAWVADHCKVPITNLENI